MINTAEYAVQRIVLQGRCAIQVTTCYRSGKLLNENQLDFVDQFFRSLVGRRRRRVIPLGTSRNEHCWMISLVLMSTYSFALAGIIEGSCMRRWPNYRSPPRTRSTCKRYWGMYNAGILCPGCFTAKKRAR